MKEQHLYEQWLQELPPNTPEHQELLAIQNNKAEIVDRFYQEMSFGTAGLRGIMGVGTNRMNNITVGYATQGLANYWNTHKPGSRAAICFDSRNHSKEFAEHTAGILAANGIHVYLFKELAPTPVLAYATQQLGCDFGIMITASHNPAQYNGYKVFNALGCQINNTVASAILAEIQKVDPFHGVKTLPLANAVAEHLLEYVPHTLREQFCDTVFAQALQPGICKEAGLQVTYTPLNGTGLEFVTEMFRRLEVPAVAIVEAQREPDGNFPTCPYPNPEFPEALELGLALAAKETSDFLLATDPDADRVAIAVRHNGEYHRISGNLLGVLLLDYITTTRTQLGTMPAEAVAVRSIVSTKLYDRIAKTFGVEVRDVLTGFKFIGEVIDELAVKGEAERYIMGFEEACGYLIGTHVRDKDAIVTTVLVCETIAALKLQGKTALDRLEELYKQYGYFLNPAQNLAFQGADGMQKMNEIMDTLRHDPPASIVGVPVTARLDYLTGTQYHSGQPEPLAFEASNVLEFHLQDGCQIMIRPSGTEPKLKIYYSIVGSSAEDVRERAANYLHAAFELTGVTAD